MTLPTTSPVHHLRALRRQDGFTMIIVLGVLVVTSLLLVAAFTSAMGEIHLTATDTAQKKAYYAAEAGIENYEYHLTQDGNYLTYCTAPSPENKSLNQLDKEGTETPLKASELSTVEVPEISGKSSEEKYAIQLIPAVSDKKPEDTAEPGWKNFPHCDKNRVVESMIEETEGPAAGTFRIQSTGFSGNEKRTITATLRNANFVSYVWYSVYETGDPVLYGEPPKEDETYYSECGKFYEEREKLPAKQCRPFNNYFIGGETVEGPMHTEDHLGICGKPVFGRNHNDRIEFGNGYNKGEKVGYSNESCGEAANPEFKGNQIPPNEVLQITPPPGDEELEHIVEEKNHYYGQTEIILNETTMTVIEHKGSHPNVEEEKEGVKKEETKTNVEFPINGVIYVSGTRPEEGEGKESCETYSPFGPIPAYTEGSACGNVYVHGKYAKALTIASQNDVIINESVYPTSVAGKLGSEPTGNAMLGLIANNFVRVYHPLTGTRQKEFYKCGSASNDTVSTPEIPKDLEEPYIYAAILALKHSFIVDNFDCGKPNLKSLNVYGAIAGEFTNGMTGVFSGKTALTGYPYNLKYDNRLQAAEPPHFLNPIEAAWYIQRQTNSPSP